MSQIPYSENVGVSRIPPLFKVPFEIDSSKCLVTENAPNLDP